MMIPKPYLVMVAPFTMGDFDGDFDDLKTKYYWFRNLHEAEYCAADVQRNQKNLICSIYKVEYLSESERIPDVQAKLDGERLGRMFRNREIEYDWKWENSKEEFETFQRLKEKYKNRDRPITPKQDDKKWLKRSAR